MRRLAIAVLLLFLAALPAAALNTRDILSLVAMPLAVAAVSELEGVPQDQLADVVTTLNQADVSPTDFVQVVRYIPVALVAQPAPQEQTFAQWLDSQSVTGPALVTTIDNRLATTYGVTPVVRPNEIVYVDRNYIPDVVVRRIQAVGPAALAASANPHGGPPGQLKKQLGLQTGAEVVHGYKPGHGEGHGRGRGHEGEARIYPQPMASGAPPVVVQPAQPVFVPPGQAKKQEGHDNDHGEGHGNEQGKGHGKGHGKD